MVCAFSWGVVWLVTQNGSHQVRLGKQNVPRLTVAGEIFTVYQRVIGAAATLVWLNLRYCVQAGQPFDLAQLRLAGLGQEDLVEAINRLEAYGLLEREDDVIIVHEPLSPEAFEVRFGQAAQPQPERTSPPSGSSRPHSQEQQRSPLAKRRKASRMLRLVEPTGEAEPENPDMQAVMQIYHKRIGMIGPTQYEKLRFWIEEMGLEGAVVALAIEETVRSAEVPRISYLEGILRNWYNDGIRTLADLHERKRASKVLSGEEARSKHDRPLEGTPNAAAYQSVSAELVAKWKELYPDEYDT